MKHWFCNKHHHFCTVENSRPVTISDYRYIIRRVTILVFADQKFIIIMTASTVHDISETKQITVSLAARSYDVHVGAGLLNQIPRIIAHLPQPRVALVTNDVIWPLYGQALSDALAASNIKVIPIILPDGESHKGWPALSMILSPYSPVISRSFCVVKWIPPFLRFRSLKLFWIKILSSVVKIKG